MTGEDLRNKLKSITIDGKKIVLKDLAEKLDMSPQLLNKRLDVQDIGTGFLQSIADALNIPISLLLEGPALLNDGGTDYKTKDKIIAEHDRKLKEIQQQLADISKKLDKNNP